MRFDSIKHLTVFKKSGRYPKIHDPIAAAIENWAGENEPACDIGACTGLLSHRMIHQCGRSKVVAVEGSATYLNLGVEDEAIRWEPYYVSLAALPELKAALIDEEVSLVVMRRVLPEILLSESEDTITGLAETLGETGASKIILQGRVPNPKCKHSLKSVKEEVEAVCRGPWEEVKTHGQVALLRKK